MESDNRYTRSEVEAVLFARDVWVGDVEDEKVLYVSNYYLRWEIVIDWSAGPISEYNLCWVLEEEVGDALLAEFIGELRRGHGN